MVWNIALCINWSDLNLTWCDVIGYTMTYDTTEVNGNLESKQDVFPNVTCVYILTTFNKVIVNIIVISHQRLSK